MHGPGWQGPTVLPFFTILLNYTCLIVFGYLLIIIYYPVEFSQLYLSPGGVKYNYCCWCKFISLKAQCFQTYFKQISTLSRLTLRP